jgi:hypothetical protein
MADQVADQRVCIAGSPCINSVDREATQSTANLALSIVRTLHLALGVDDDACIVFKVQEDAILPTPRFALADDDGGHDCASDRQRRNECMGDSQDPC